VPGAALLLLLALAQSPGPASPPASAPPSPPPPASSITPEDRSHLEALRAALKGREDRPAREVFKNVKLLGDVPAGRLLRVMEWGYARSLGQSCSFCHVPGSWESDTNKHKVIARQMALMMRAINQEFLAKMPELTEDPADKPAVNCTTCHRGQKKPALELEGGSR
jgi:hypothetical protein